MLYTREYNKSFGAFHKLLYKIPSGQQLWIFNTLCTAWQATCDSLGPAGRARLVPPDADLSFARNIGFSVDGFLRKVQSASYARLSKFQRQLPKVCSWNLNYSVNHFLGAFQVDSRHFMTVFRKSCFPFFCHLSQIICIADILQMLCLYGFGHFDNVTLMVLK